MHMKAGSFSSCGDGNNLAGHSAHTNIRITTPPGNIVCGNVVVYIMHWPLSGILLVMIFTPGARERNALW